MLAAPQIKARPEPVDTAGVPASKKRFALSLVTGASVALSSAGSAGLGAPPGPAVAVRSIPSPPPDLPLHGHRHEHRTGALLRFDSRLGVYVVSGASGIYYFGDAFIRVQSGRWEFSDRPDGPWAPGRAEWVPLTLRTGLYRR